MAIYRVQGPDGAIHKFEGPDDATPEQVEAFAAQQFGGSKPSEEKYDPTEGMSTGEKFLAGVGMGMTNVGRGIGQALGMVSRDDIAEARRLDKALSDTTAGTAGNITGTVAAFLPTAFIPGANTMAGAAAIGAGSGLLAPSTSTSETVTNTALGGTLAPLTLAGIRAIPAITQGVGALVQPFTRSGQDRIAGNTLRAFAGSRQAADDAANAMRGATSEVPGVANTMGEVSNNAGLAQLERALRQNPELTTEFTDRIAGNREAMLQALRGIAGDDATMAAAQRARSAAADPLYAASRAQNILPDQELATLSQRPAMQEAFRRAEAIMAEQGGQASPGAFLHNVKMALDDMLQTGPQRGVGAQEAGTIRGTRAAFIDWLERQSPEYAAGRAAFRDASRPINQMEIGQELVNRFQPALSDFGAGRTTPATYATALRNADQTAARATRMPNATMESVLTPEQMRTVRGVATELAKRANAEELGRQGGSPTAQNLVSQNFLRQTLGPLGLPESFAEGTLVNSLMRLPQFAARLGEQRVLNRLAEVGLNPQQAAALMQQAGRPSLTLQGANALSPFAPSLALSVNGLE